MLDLDPGQPVFSLAGCLSLVKVSQVMLTNDISLCDLGFEIISKIYVDSCSPSSSLAKYKSCAIDLMSVFKMLGNN